MSGGSAKSGNAARRARMSVGWMAMTVLVDQAMWPAHGRLWAHLVSDESLAELHAFAAANDIPRRAFDRDHYDVPEDALPRLVAAGATAVSAHELTRALIASGLRVRARDRR